MFYYIIISQIDSPNVCTAVDAFEMEDDGSAQLEERAMTSPIKAIGDKCDSSILVERCDFFLALQFLLTSF